MKIDAYIRVSSVRGRSGETFISPDVQEDRIRSWATANGHEVIAAHRELDESGGKMDRPLLNEAMARIDSGETQGLVVYRLDRFGRTLVGSLDLIDRIRNAGALFASVSDSFDITTETGRLVLNIMLSIAQYERERIGANWREARTRAVSRGVHIAARPPIGYLREPGGRLEVDPAAGVLVTEMFRRRAAGQSWARIRDFLNDGTGRAWSTATVQKIVRNRVYLGEAVSGRDKDGQPIDVFKDAHPALTDPATWQAAQDRRGARSVERQPVVVARGLVRCAGCRYVAMVTPRYRDGEVVAWDIRCRREKLKGDCPAPINVVAQTSNGTPGLDDVVVAAMFSRLDLVEFEAVDMVDDLEALEADYERAEAAYGRVLTDTELEDQIGPRAFRLRLAAFEATRDEKRAILDEALRRAGRASLDRPVRELREEWPGLTIEQQQRHLANTIQTVFVRRAAQNGNGDRTSSLRGDRFVASLAERMHVVWATEAPVDVPRQGRRDWTPCPFVFPDTAPHDVGLSLA
jgi:DNA invertase Pin-like site-specific DNA recombinase